MTVFGFLAALPAILGVTGFALYLLLKDRGKDPLLERIVDKLRVETADRLVGHNEHLTSHALAKAIKGDQRLRAIIGEQDCRLLEKLLHHRFVTSLVVYVLCALLFLVGVAGFIWVSTRTPPLTISNVGLIDEEPEASSLLVDLDRLTITWSASGSAREVRAYIENVDSKSRSTEFAALSSDGKVTFTPADFRAVLASREHRGRNRVRAVVRSDTLTEASATSDLLVGTKISVVAFPEKVTIMARIDNQPVHFHDFEATLSVWTKRPNDIVAFGRAIKYSANDFPLDSTREYDWTSAKLVYFGPDDPRIVRPEFLGLAER